MDGKTLLVKNIHTLATMDKGRREIPDGAVLVRGNVIDAVGATAELPETADEILDLKDRYVVMPGHPSEPGHLPLPPCEPTPRRESTSPSL